MNAVRWKQADDVRLRSIKDEYGLMITGLLGFCICLECDLYIQKIDTSLQK